MKVTKKLAGEFVEAILDTIDNQPSATPCIFISNGPNGKIDFTPGDRSGIAASVYNNEAYIVIDSKQLKEWFYEYRAGEWTKSDLTEMILDRIEDYKEEIGE
jgi:hypothetical protein